MAYGFRSWNADGDLTVDSDSILTRHVWSNTYAADSFGTTTLSGGKTILGDSTAYFVYVKVLESNKVPHDIWITESGNDIIVNYNARFLRINFFDPSTTIMYSGDTLVNIVKWE